MKGISIITTIIFVLIISVISLVIFFLLTSVFKQYSGDSSTLSIPREFEKTTYDYTRFLLDPNAIDNFDNLRDEPRFCTILKSCIKKAIISGRPCELPYTIGEIPHSIAYGKDLESDIGLPPIGLCNDEELYIDVADNIQQKICYFKRATTWMQPSQEISDAAGLSFDNCRINSLIGNEVYYDPYGDLTYASNVEENNLISSSPDTVYYYYSPDYMYTPYYPHYPVQSNRLSQILNLVGQKLVMGHIWYNGPGRLIITVGKARFNENGECVYNAYICPQPAISTPQFDPTLKIFDVARTLELYHHADIPYYIRKLDTLLNGLEDFVYYNRLGYPKVYRKIKSPPYSCTKITRLPLPPGVPIGVDLYNCESGVEKYDLCIGVLPNYHCPVSYTIDAYVFNKNEIGLDKDYKSVTIINAIKSGLYQNFDVIKSHWAHPHWDIRMDSRLKYSNECWMNSEYEYRIRSEEKEHKTRSIYYNCGTDNVCSGNITIKSGFRIDQASTNYFELIYLSGIITFCDNDCTSNIDCLENQYCDPSGKCQYR